MFCVVINLCKKLYLFRTVTFKYGIVYWQMKNKLLEQMAYTDAHTGLPNKGACEALLRDQDAIVEPTVCIMFDLNNLKTAVENNLILY